MQYWSRWTNIAMTASRADDEKDTRPSWQVRERRQTRETRPVVVIARSRTQELSTPFARQRGRTGTCETSPRISLDVRRQSGAYTSASRPVSLASWVPEATTEEF